MIQKEKIINWARHVLKNKKKKSSFSPAEHISFTLDEGFYC